MHLVSLLHMLTGKKLEYLPAGKPSLSGSTGHFQKLLIWVQQDKAQVTYKSGPPLAFQRTAINWRFACGLMVARHCMLAGKHSTY